MGIEPGVGDSGKLTELGHDHTDYYFCRDFIQYTQESLQTYLAKESIAKLREAATRLTDLAENELYWLETLKLSEAARRFLQLLKMSYIWGFYAQCIIICRSVIEDVLRRKIDSEKHQAYCLYEYIEVAKREGLINSELANKSGDIRVRANKIIHDDPGLTKKARETIFDTIRIIYMLETGKDPSHIDL